MMYFIVACFIALDLVTGIIKALKDKKFTSTTMREGLLHKCALVLCIAFGVLVDYGQVYLALGVSVPIAGAICTYITLMECGSIIENLGTINPSIIPNKLKSFFEKIN